LPECYADRDVFVFLKAHCRLRGRRSPGKKEEAEIGMVDEDPLSSHHRERDRMESMRESPSLEVRRRDERHLLIVRPDLERCFLRSMRLANLRSQLGERPADLRTFLNLPMHPKHRVFREELEQLHARSRERRIDTLIPELERAVRDILQS
jgi:hypothetical protein